MDTFEKQFENLDVQSGVMNDAMNKQAALSLNMPQAGTAVVAAPPAAVEEEDDLQARLAALRGA